MAILQKSKPYSTWVTTLHEAVKKNFAMDAQFRCNSYFEDGELIAKSVFAKLLTNKFGKEAASAEIGGLWPQNSYGTLISNKALDSDRTKVKINLIQNYFKFYGN